VDNPERQELVERHMPLVATLACKLGRRGCPLEDLKSQGYVALCEAVNLFRPDEHGDASFAAFARNRIRWRMQEAIDEAPLIHTPRRRPAECRPTRSEIAIEDYGIMTRAEDPELAEMVEQAQAMLACCAEPGRTILGLHRGLDGPALSILQIARRLEMTCVQAQAHLEGACRTIAAEMRRRNWTSESWSEAIAG
jgi:RNA polymerase sigma factor (sigma-70 family)